MKSIFLYTDYKKYLADYISDRKKLNKNFSYAYFAEETGFKSRSFIHKVIRGEKALSLKRIGRVGKAMGLGKKEQAYLRYLVHFDTEKTPDKKLYYYTLAQSVHKSNSSVLLRKDQFEYFRRWYLAALREAVIFCDFGDDFKKLGVMMRPPISAKTAKKGVQLLLRLKLIARKDGRYVQTDQVITTGNEVKSLAVTNFQKETMDLATGALALSLKEREISTLTFGTNEPGFRQLQSEIIAFRKKCIDIICSHQPIDRVYQLNFQLFPLSQSRRKKEEAS
jgi:uncharacterized protein (TIGR02147 family)